MCLGGFLWPLFVAGPSDALFTSMFSLLDKHAVSKDSSADFPLPGEYVTTGFWRPVLSSETKGEISAVVKKKVVFDLPHVNDESLADVMVVRRVGTRPVPNLVVLARLSVRSFLQHMRVRVLILTLRCGSL